MSDLNTVVDSYVVLVNSEGQHSLWPAFKKVPGGWEKVCEASTKEMCLEYVERNWIDMRPKSIRK